MQDVMFLERPAGGSAPRHRVAGESRAGGGAAFLRARAASDPISRLWEGGISVVLFLGAVDPPAKSLTFCWLKGNMRGIPKVKV